jgi:hypothetical protein
MRKSLAPYSVPFVILPVTFPPFEEDTASGGCSLGITAGTLSFPSSSSSLEEPMQDSTLTECTGHRNTFSFTCLKLQGPHTGFPLDTPNYLEYLKASLDWVETPVIGHHIVTNNAMRASVSLNIGHSKESASMFVRQNNL